jgi:hypothetical protein
VSLHLVRLPASEGGTACLVAVHRDARSGPVAVITDGSANPGLSAHRVLDALTSKLLTQLPPSSQEPIWVLSWPERAVASVLLDDAHVPTYHLLRHDHRGWHLAPLPAAALDDLLRPLPGSDPAPW